MNNQMLVSAPVKRNRKKIPVKGILTSIPFWATLLTTVSHDFTFYVQMSQLPIYMKTMLHFNVSENAIFSAILYLTMWVCSIGTGVIADAITRKGRLRLTFNRKIFITIGTFLPAVFVAGAIHSRCNSVGVIICFIFAAGTQGAYSAGWINFIDLSPGFGPLITSIASTLGACQAIVQPILVAEVVGGAPSFAKWQILAWVMFMASCFSTGIYLWFGTAKRQQWDIDATLTEEEKEKYQLQKKQ